MSATAGGFARTLILETAGVHLKDDDCTPEGVAAVQKGDLLEGAVEGLTDLRVKVV